MAGRWAFLVVLEICLILVGPTENTGRFAVDGSGYVANVGALSINPTILQQSYIFVGPGATLNLTNQPSGIPDVVFHSTYEIGGTFSAGGDNPFQNLHSIEGHLDIFNGQTTNIVPSGGASVFTAIVLTTRQLGGERRFYREHRW